MLTLDTLRACGADVEDGLNRCMGMEAMYLQLVEMGLKDRNFDRLIAAVEDDDRKAAFEAVHALKGVAGNLSLTPLYEAASEMTELLRSEASPSGRSEGNADCSAFLARILTEREKLLALCGG